jgi:hypothetical protein
MGNSFVEYKENIVTVRKFCVDYSFMGLTNETVQSVMLHLVAK